MKLIHLWHHACARNIHSVSECSASVWIRPVLLKRRQCDNALNSPQSIFVVIINCHSNKRRPTSPWSGHHLLQPVEWVAQRPLPWSVLHLLWLNAADNVICWAAFPWEQLSAKTNWPRLSASLIVSWTSPLPWSHFSSPHESGASRHQLELKKFTLERKEFVVVDVVGQFKLQYAFYIEIQIQMFISWVREILKSLWWNIDCLLG